MIAFRLSSSANFATLAMFSRDCWPMWEATFCFDTTLLQASISFRYMCFDFSEVMFVSCTNITSDQSKHKYEELRHCTLSNEITGAVSQVHLGNQSALVLAWRHTSRLVIKQKTSLEGAAEGIWPSNQLSVNHIATTNKNQSQWSHFVYVSHKSFFSCSSC